MNGLNAIVVDGKVYEAVEIKDQNPCISCDLEEICLQKSLETECQHILGSYKCFIFSQELTDKLNKE